MPSASALEPYTTRENWQSCSSGNPRLLRNDHKSERPLTGLCRHAVPLGRVFALASRRSEGAARRSTLQVKAVERSIYLINPAESAAGWHGMEVLPAWGIAPVTNFADLSTPTVAALVPDGWRVSLCDERVSEVDMSVSAAVIGITGKVTQRARALALADAFRARGKLVVIGGSGASLEPKAYQDHADILVTGELEAIAGELFGDIAAGTYRSRYDGGRPDLSSSPVPRWDLYPRNIALNAQVQTSRGCPFECEFCDVIQYLGRKQRSKDAAQVLAELEELYVRGYRHVLFADDNFTVVRKRARELLSALVAWNNRRLGGRMQFATQVSVDLARDPELMDLCVAANLRIAFVGIETPNVDSLAETLKRQNLRVDLAEEVRKITRSGIMVLCGIIVGFDHDGPDIFERQRAFIGELPVPIIHFGTLVAPSSTPLYTRLQKEGRIANDWSLGAGNVIDTNIVPKLMSSAQLAAGARWLINQIYAPAAFAARLRSFVSLAPVRDAGRPAFSPIERKLSMRLAAIGPEEARLAAMIRDLALRRPDLAGLLRYCLLSYCQARYMLDELDIWDPRQARRERSMA